MSQQIFGYTAAASDLNFVEKGVFSVASAAISGISSLANSVASLSGGIFTENDDPLINKADAVEGLLGEQGRAFYLENQLGLDIGGEIAASLIPGTLAVKGLRLAQGSKFAMTGWREAQAALAGAPSGGISFGSILRPVTAADDLIKAARLSMAQGAEASVFKPLINKAIGSFSYQGALEGAAFEYAAELFLKEGTLYDKASTAETLLWNPLVSASLGGIFGAASGIYKVYGAGIRADIGTSSFGKSLKPFFGDAKGVASAVGEHPAETLGFSSLRNSELLDDLAVKISTTTDEQGKAILNAELSKLTAQADRELQRTAISAAKGDLAPEVLYEYSKNLDSLSLASQMAGVKSVGIVGHSVNLADDIVDNTVTLFRASDDTLHAVSKRQELLDSGRQITGAVSLKDTIQIHQFDSPQAINLRESKAAVFIQREADGSFTAPNGLQNAAVAQGWSKADAKTAKSINDLQKLEQQSREGLTATVVIDIKTKAPVMSGVLHQNLGDLISVAKARKGPVSIGFQNPETGESYYRILNLNPKDRLLAADNTFEWMATKGLDKYDSIDFQTAWLTEAARATENVKAGRALTKKAFDEDLFQAASHVDALEAAGKTELVLETAPKVFADPITIAEAREIIAARKLEAFERFKFAGLADAELEQRLKISLTEGTVATAEGLAGIGVDFSKPKYLALETNVFKAGLFKEAAEANARYMLDRQQWRMQYSNLANEVVTGLIGSSFPDLDYRNFKSAVNAGVPKATLATNVQASPSVLAAGAYAQVIDRKFTDIASEADKAWVSLRNKIVSQDAIAEYAALELKFHSSPGSAVPLVVVDSTKAMRIVSKEVEAANRDFKLAADKALKAGDEAQVAALQKKQMEFLEKNSQKIKNPEVADIIMQQMQMKNKLREIRDPFQALHGKPQVANTPNELFFPPIDPLDTPFVLFKRTPGPAGQLGKMEGFVARNAEEFQAMKTRMQSQVDSLEDGFVGATLHTTDDIKRYKTLKDEYEFNKDFLSATFSSEAQRKGIILGAPSSGLAGRDLASRMETWVHTQYRTAGDELKFAAWPQINELQMLHSDWVAQNVTSTFGKGSAKNSQFDIDRQLVSEATSPYSVTLDLLMNKSREDRTAIPGLINRAAQAAYDKGMEWISKRTGAVLSDPKLVKNILTDQELISLSKEAQYYGVNSDFLQTARAFSKDQGIHTPELMGLVHKLNGFSQFLTLRMDAMNPLVNLISTPVTGIPHLLNLVNTLRKENGGQLPGKLAEVLGVKVDGAVGSLTMLKVYSQAAREFHGTKDLAKNVLETIGKDGKNLQHRQNLIDIRSGIFVPNADRNVMEKALTGAADYVQQNKIVEMLGRWSDHAEEFTQFLGARSGQIIAEAAGLSAQDTRLFMAGFAEQVNNSTNRAARHSFYNGPVGAVLGLYQNYMRGMMTRTLQFLQEGDAKSVLEMAGLQAGLFGFRSLPLMDFYNRNLLGENNASHADAFTAIYGLNGKALGDFISYGAGSSLLGVNVFTRAELTPFSATVLPLPWDSAAAKTLINIGKLGGEVMESMGSLLKGDVTFAKNNFLYAMEHNGLNRPIGRVAAMVQGYSTTINGQPVYKFGQEEDRGIWGGIMPGALAWPVTIAAGLAGTSSLTEAVNKDVLQRFTAYQLEDKKIRNEFNKNMRLEAGVGSLTEERQTELAAKYIEQGGTPAGFKTSLARATLANQTDNMQELFKSPSMQKTLKSAQVILGPNASLNPDPYALRE